MAPAAGVLVLVAAAVTLISIVLVLTGHVLGGLIVLLAPLGLVLLALGVYGLLAVVAFIMGRLDALSADRRAHRAGRRNDKAR